MPAQYIIRFDDICPTMNWTTWHQIETFLYEHNVKPIIAVIPNNQDQSLFIDKPKQDFWARVKQWQDDGWTIALHGLNHKYHTTESGILGINNRSEFAGVSKERQYDALSKAQEIFRTNNIMPDIWVAPSHSFDHNTINILNQLGLTSISDGFSFRPFIHHELLWIPQQIWRFRKLPFGLWTVCLHHNNWKESDVDKFIEKLRPFLNQLTTFQKIKDENSAKKRNFNDIFFHIIFSIIMKVKYA